VDSQSLITWGLGAIVLLLMVSTVVQIFQRVFPTVRDMFNETAGDARYTFSLVKTILPNMALKVPKCEIFHRFDFRCM
jgi:hypothetical protein